MISDPKLPLASDPAGLPEVDAVPGSSSRPAENEETRQIRHLWLRRLGVLVFVFVCATIGVMLIILPWRPEWSDNHLLLPFPSLRSIIASGFVRGVCTGLGLLNVWIGFWEAIQYKEED
jgi:hypothetical protein